MRFENRLVFEEPERILNRIRREFGRKPFRSSDNANWDDEVKPPRSSTTPPYEGGEHIPRPAATPPWEGGELGELETLPNIDINIKCGNSLISRYGLDTDVHKLLRNSRWDIDSYRLAVMSYRNAESKQEKHGLEQLIEDIKKDFEAEVAEHDKRLIRKHRLEGELFNITKQQNLFDLTKKEQKEWNAKIDRLMYDIQKLDKELEEIKQSKIYQNAFEWRFEFPEVLNDQGDFVGFDVVIGNPPYIRQEELKWIKSYLKEHYDVYCGTADILAYFIERGIKLLKTDGHFVFITANKFLRAAYGEALRKWLQQYQIMTLLDFGDLPVFKEASTYPLIIAVQKSKQINMIKAANVSTLNFTSLMRYADEYGFKCRQDKLSNNGWILSSSKEQDLVEKLRNTGSPLAEYVKNKIFRGILTGLNEVFVIDREQRDSFISTNHACKKVIKPFLLGRDIKRFQLPFAKKYLILFPKGWTRDRYGDLDVDAAYKRLIDDFPSIGHHLIRFKERAKKRYDKGDYWWELRACDYYDEFEKPKIILPDISKRGNYTIDDKGEFYIVNTAYIIGSDEKSLLGILSSKVIDFFYRNISASYRGGYLRFIYQYLAQIPIVMIPDYVKKQITNIVTKILNIRKSNPNANTDTLEQEIDRIVYRLYELTPEEIRIVEESV